MAFAAPSPQCRFSAALTGGRCSRSQSTAMTRRPPRCVTLAGPNGAAWCSRPRSSGDRASASGAEGRRFESCRGHHLTSVNVRPCNIREITGTLDVGLTTSPHHGQPRIGSWVLYGPPWSLPGPVRAGFRATTTHRHQPRSGSARNTHVLMGGGCPARPAGPATLPTVWSSKAESTKQKFESRPAQFAVSAHNPRCD